MDSHTRYPENALPGNKYANQSLFSDPILCDSRSMKTVTIMSLLLLPLAALARDTQELYRWMDLDGQVHYGDSIPAEYAEMEKQILNDHGVTIGTLRGKKSEAEIAAEKLQAQLTMKAELRRRADRALLATYMSTDEILMHRDRRIELFQAQTRVTELYVRNLQRRLDNLLLSAEKFQPYADDLDAPMIDRELTEDIVTTKETIARHENNLQRFALNEIEIVSRFQLDIERFRRLKGLDQQAAVTSPISPN